jgi:hypothetical protein
MNSSIKYIRILTSILLASGYTQAYGSFSELPIGGRAIGMASAYVAVALGPESIFYNPGGLSQSTVPTLSLFFSRPYGLKELSYETISTAIPTHIGSFGLAFHTFGYTLYRENMAAFGWSYAYRRRLFFGLLLRTTRIQIKNYGSDAAFSIDAGCLLKLTHNILCGFSATNINHATLGRQQEPLPRLVRIGLSYTPVNGILFSLEVDKEAGYPAELRGGCEFNLASCLWLRCGFSREPSQFNAGVGLSQGPFDCDYAFGIHPILGATHQVSFSIRLRKDASGSKKDKNTG